MLVHHMLPATLYYKLFDKFCISASVLLVGTVGTSLKISVRTVARNMS